MLKGADEADSSRLPRTPAGRYLCKICGWESLIPGIASKTVLDLSDGW